MKNFILFLSFFILTNLALSQQKGGIYYISFRLDELLTNDVKVTFNDNKFFSSYSEAPIFPEGLVDSIKIAIEDKMSEKLNANVNCIYSKNKNGKTITTIGLAGELEGMPVNSKSAAIKSNERDIYIRFDVNITSSGGYTITLANNSKSKYRPKLSIRAVAFDSSGKKIFSAKKTTKDFGKLRSKERTSADGSVTVRKAQILYPEDIYLMFTQALGQF